MSITAVYPTCPACGNVHTDAHNWGMHDGDVIQVNCYKCGAPFVCKFNQAAAFITTPFVQETIPGVIEAPVESPVESPVEAPVEAPIDPEFEPHNVEPSEEQPRAIPAENDLEK